MMSKRRITKISADASLGHLFKTELPLLSKGNENMQSSPHVCDTGHETATVFTEDVKFPEGGTFLVEGAAERNSFLLQEFVTSGLESFTYQNETKVQNLVALCLKDALHSQDLLRFFDVESEFSIFSFRPDIIVVSHSTKGIVLVIEVKKPGIEVFESHDVGGQLYDYLVGNLLSGVSTPFAVLTSYDEMCIAYLDDDGISREILMRNAEKLGEDIGAPILKAFGIVDQSPSSPPSSHQSDSKKPSPESKLNRVFDINHEVGEERDDDEGGDDEEDEDEPWNRAVVYTQTFGGKEAIKALVLALRCGLESVARSEPRNVPKSGESACGSCAKVNKTGLVWTNMPESIKFNYHDFPGASTDMMYLWRDLGRGSKGRVFLACNTSGRACAVKFFIIDYSTYHRQAEPAETRQICRESQMKLMKTEAEKERDYWIKVYGETFADQVRVTQLNNLWCLMMPYFDQVPNNKRESCLDAVRNHLTDFKAMDLHYRTEDLCWRHIGVRCGAVYIFDLGSLEERDKTDIDVDASMRMLQEKIDKRS